MIRGSQPSQARLNDPRPASALLALVLTGLGYGTPWVLSALYPLELIEDRAGLSFRYGELGPFEYDIVRTMYLDYREALIADER